MFIDSTSVPEAASQESDGGVGDDSYDVCGKVAVEGRFKLTIKIEQHGLVLGS